mmetsp:Transcript_1391/g.3884  ORF Transcript_1391/g.3884 Transcript_1391/m.3884 type:complete len:203 (-) Transcript_1391:737-1345(-)
MKREVVASAVIREPLCLVGTNVHGSSPGHPHGPWNNIDSGRRRLGAGGRAFVRQDIIWRGLPNRKRMGSAPRKALEATDRVEQQSNRFAQTYGPCRQDPSVLQAASIGGGNSSCPVYEPLPGKPKPLKPANVSPELPRRASSAFAGAEQPGGRAAPTRTERDVEPHLRRGREPQAGQDAAPRWIKNCAQGGARLGAADARHP